MKTTFKAEKTISINYEIELPYYCKNSINYYKIIDDNVAIKVEIWSPKHYSISMLSSDVAFNSSEKPCDKEEFDLAFQQVSSYINRINE